MGKVAPIPLVESGLFCTVYYVNDGTADGEILPAAALAAMTDMQDVKIVCSAGTGSAVDIMTSNADVVSRLQGGSPLDRGTDPANTWSGTGSVVLR